MFNKELNILNNDYMSPNDLLSAEQKYSVSQARHIISILKSALEDNRKRRTGVGLYGNQIRECLYGVLMMITGLSQKQIIDRTKGLSPDLIDSVCDLTQEEADEIESIKKEYEEKEEQKRQDAEEKKEKMTDFQQLGDVE